MTHLTPSDTGPRRDELTRLGDLLARAFVKLRLLVILAWVAGAAWAMIALPSIGSTESSPFGSLVPKNAPAVRAERLSAELFRVPLLSRTVIVVRNPHGLSAVRRANLTALAERLSMRGLPGFGEIAAAVPLVNSPRLTPFAREHDTTMLLYLYFPSGVDSYARSQAARRLVAEQVGHRPGEYEGVTGQEPGRFRSSRSPWRMHSPTGSLRSSPSSVASQSRRRCNRCWSSSSLGW